MNKISKQNQIINITWFIFLYTALSITGIILFSLNFRYWSQYGWSYLWYDYKLNNYIPNNVQAVRALLVFIAISIVFLLLFIILKTIKLQDIKLKKIIFYSGFIFVWVLLPYLMVKITKDDYLKGIFANNVIRLDYCKILTPKKIIYILKNKNKNYKNELINTLLLYIVFVFSSIGFVLLFTSEFAKNKSQYDVENNIIFSVFSYFTDLSNFGVFFITIFYLFFGNSKLFKTEQKMTYMVSYITMVFFIYWLALFPNIISEGIWKKYEMPITFVNTLWAHLFTPIIFITYFVLSNILIKKEYKDFKMTLTFGLIWPIIYGIYTYTLPFIAQFSTYNQITNLNPESLTFKKGFKYHSTSPSGGYLAIIYLMLLCLLFVSLISSYHFIAKKIQNKFHKTSDYIVIKKK